MSNNKLKFGVIGAGCGGMAIAGYLAASKYDVTLYNRSLTKLTPLINNKNKITLTGVIRREGHLSYVGTDMSVAIADRDIIMVVTTATGHKEIAAKMAPYLKDGQIVILNPGRTFGALEFESVVSKKIDSSNIIISEASTLMCAARSCSPGTIEIKGIKKEVRIAALRASDTNYITTKIRSVFPQFKSASSIIETSFGNIGAVFHPAITLMNKDLIKKGHSFKFYTEGITNNVANVIENVSQEMRNVSRALGTETISITEWLRTRYGLAKSDFLSMIRSNPTYQEIPSPESLNHRYLWEDIPTGLVPISSAGKALDIRTEAIDHLIDLGETVLDRNFRAEGRTIESLGLSSENLRQNLNNIIFPDKKL